MKTGISPSESVDTDFFLLVKQYFKFSQLWLNASCRTWRRWQQSSRRLHTWPAERGLRRKTQLRAKALPEPDVKRPFKIRTVSDYGAAVDAWPGPGLLWNTKLLWAANELWLFLFIWSHFICSCLASLSCLITQQLQGPSRTWTLAAGEVLISEHILQVWSATHVVLVTFPCLAS